MGGKQRRLNLRLRDEMFDAVQSEAVKEFRTMNQQVEFFIAQGLQKSNVAGNGTNGTNECHLVPHPGPHSVQPFQQEVISKRNTFPIRFGLPAILRTA